MKALIIEDELPAADQLKRLLKKNAPFIEVLQVSRSITESVTWLNINSSPDIIFMDIELTDGMSFEIFQQIEISSHVIFTTAYDSYAIKAIKLNALDYLLKPVNEGELKQAIVKAEKQTLLNNRDPEAFAELQNIKDLNPKKLRVNTINGSLFILIEDIIRLEATSNYTNIFTKDKNKVMASRTLKEFEELLSDCGFYRVHNSHLINLSYVTRYLKGEGGAVLLANGQSIEVSRRRKKGLLDLLIS